MDLVNFFRWCDYRHRWRCLPDRISRKSSHAIALTGWRNTCPLHEHWLLKVEELRGADRRMSARENERVVLIHPHHLVRSHHRARNLWLRGAGSAAGYSALRMTYSGFSGHCRDPLCRFDAIWRKRHTRIAIAGDRLVMTVGRVNLAQVLRDETGTQPVSGNQGKRLGENFKPPEDGKFIQHQEQRMFVVRDSTAISIGHRCRQGPDDLVEDQANEGTQAIATREWYYQVQRDGPFVIHQIADLKLGPFCIRGDNQIAIQRQEGHCSGKDTGPFI